MPAGVLWTTLAHGLVAVASIGFAWNGERKHQHAEVEATSQPL
jgi:hypothetical protein